MIDQIKLIGIALNLIVGFSLVTYIYNLSKIYLLSYLRMILLNTICVNFVFLLLFISKYLEINISILLNTNEILKDFLYLIGYLLLLGLSFSILQIESSFRKKKLKIWLKRNILILTSFVSAMFLLKLFCSNTIVNQWHYHIYNNLALIILPIEFIILIKILFIQNDNIYREELKVYKLFAILYLSRYAFILFGYFVFPEFIRITLIIFYINLIPFWWIRFIFLPYFKNNIITSSESYNLDLLVTQFNLSDREKEIMQFILENKSNNDIGNILFISPKTVKNHIYNLYRKIGINSRYKLIDIVLKMRNY